jgi:hypothetical protein
MRAGADDEGTENDAMRILEQKKVPYTAHEYAHGDGPVDGVPWRS